MKQLELQWFFLKVSSAQNLVIFISEVDGMVCANDEPLIVEAFGRAILSKQISFSAVLSQEVLNGLGKIASNGKIKADGLY